MGSRFKSVVGWERYGDILLLRMKLTQPELKRVWPGTPSLTEPQSELRLLHDELIPYDDVKDAMIKNIRFPDSKYSAADLGLLSKAIGEIPKSLQPHRQCTREPAPLA